MEIRFDEALKIFKLDYDYTERTLKKAYHSLAKIYHPDASSLENEDKMKKINANYEYLLKRLKRKEAREKEDREREEKLKKEIFEQGIINLRQEISYQLEKYKDNKIVERVCNEYLTLLDKVENQNELDKLRLNFQKVIKETVDKINEQMEKEYMAKRNEMKNYFLYKNYSFCLSNGVDCIRGAELLRKLLELIYTTPCDELEKLMPSINEIGFVDLDHDFKVLESLTSKYQIYIEISTGTMYLGKPNNDYIEMSRVSSKTTFSIPINDLKNDFISLSDFFKKAYYVGDRKAYTVEGVKRSDAAFGTCEYLYYLNDLILAKEVYYYDDECIDRFYFISTKYSDYRYEFTGYKYNFENEKYRDKKTCMDAIYDSVEFIEKYSKGKTL